MSDYIYRPNLYTPADHEAQIRTFEAMARKGWQLESYGRFMLRYRKAEPAETRYTMTFLREKNIKGIEYASKHRIIDRALQNGWALVCDSPLMDLQVFRTDRLNPVPIVEDDRIHRKQTALFLRKQHLRQRLFFMLLPLLTFLFYANDGLSPIRMVALPDFFYPYALAAVLGLYSLCEGFWYILWRLFRIPACTIPRLLLRLTLLPLWGITLWSICVAGLRMTAFLLLALIVTLLAALSYRLLKRRFYENRALAAPMFILLIFMLSLFMADIVINLYIEDDTMLTLSNQPAPVTIADLGYDTEVPGPYGSHTPVADYMIYGQMDATADSYFYYEVCTIPSDLLRSMIVRAAKWMFWMKPADADPRWDVQAYYTASPNVYDADCAMFCKEDTIYFIYGFPEPGSDRLVELLTQ
ncbi:MAG: DUF2812 domain-containing protein [Clostridia bacterium]|nr:DUF2812 domain-containing protein [Clostridia bacterium]